jgi:hypothetical protein
MDVHIRPDDGGVFSLLAATPNNMFWCMDNAGMDDYFGTPPVCKIARSALYTGIV